jgi:hypothetical protein
VIPLQKLYLFYLKYLIRDVQGNQKESDVNDLILVHANADNVSVLGGSINIIKYKAYFFITPIILIRWHDLSMIAC